MENTGTEHLQKPQGTIGANTIIPTVPVLTTGENREAVDIIESPALSNENKILKERLLLLKKNFRMIHQNSELMMKQLEDLDDEERTLKETMEAMLLKENFHPM